MSNHRITIHPLRFIAGVAGLVFILGSWTHLWQQSDEGMFVFLVMVSAFPLGFVCWLMWTGRRGSCPACETPLGNINWFDINSRECRVCGQYIRSRKGVLELISDDHLGEQPVYRTGCPDQIQWPGGCCVCGAPPTREQQISLVEQQTRATPGNVALAAATGVAMKNVSTITVAVPHCDTHLNGAALQRGADTDGARLEILFRSRAFCQKFEQLNGKNTF